MTLGQISWRPWFIGTAGHEGFCCLSSHYAAGLWRCGVGCLCAHLSPHGVSSGRTPSVSWPGRDRGGAQVAGALLSVGLARFLSLSMLHVLARL
jgi:hypothetical protein